ncbi:Cytochrome P450 [Mycena venus]|uniref:Cytochrome P450 n=1 Tax=Mycena venus TaxID=2733690 RepID=A0A8H6WNQ3_9AGAR|nr:Cytochrome P450 [Mycena venus]
MILLSKPFRTVSGGLNEKFPIRKGTVLTTSILHTNLSKTIWVGDAPDFKPERWPDDSAGVPASAKQYPGFHHTMTFLDGPRMCLRMGFAIAEMKIVLSLLIRTFMFSSRDEADTKYEKAFLLEGCGWAQGSTANADEKTESERHRQASRQKWGSDSVSSSSWEYVYMATK